jgi:hypothetical protein
MAVPINDNLHRLAEDLPKISSSTTVEMARLHGEDILHDEGKSLGANELKPWLLARPGGFYVVEVSLDHGGHD